MAMKMRHNTLGYSFARKTRSDAPTSLQQNFLGQTPDHIEEARPLNGELDVRSQRSAASRSPCLGEFQRLEEVQGPDNLIGLRTIFLHPFCLPLIAVPLGILSELLRWGHIPTFWINFIALMPLAKILGDATEELAAGIGSDAISALLNATFGNAVELIVAVQSLRAELYSVTKATLLGSVLSNLLLVLGCSFLAGGISPSRFRHGRFHCFNAPVALDRCISGFEKEQKFAVKGALMSMAMLLFSCMSFTIPTIFQAFPTDDRESVLKVSRIGACIMISSYVAFMIFQLFTHSQTLSKEEHLLRGSASSDDSAEGYDEEVVESASITPLCAVLLMLISTLVVSINSELLVNVIKEVVEAAGIPEGFIGAILLPIAGNACEHLAAIRFAIRDKPGLSIGIAVGSSTQIALLVLPLIVVVGWLLNKPLDLDCGILNVAVVGLSLLVVLTLLLDGRSNWFKGYILVALYLYISVLYWFYPYGFGQQ
eukprot:TRINITY_DN96166_c0_g1_i1.p1 TRINITY_DN96166_c0_g1~~TRINITY_DN96166_c0_g1_i1.p1  ORF type:complete len:524 (-),score=78.37 TRINITY_DN96166_c0_g1_i1:79-1527(-)